MMELTRFPRTPFCTALVALWTANVLASPISFFDVFGTNTTAAYTWFEEGNGGDNNPLNNYTYDPLNKWVTITTADNCNIYVGASLPRAIQAGFFQFGFMPLRTYPTDGLVRMRLFGMDGRSYMYMWHFAHNSGLPDAGENDGYRAHLEKWVDGTAIIQEVFIPTPDHYSLGEWHTMGMSFSPLSISGYLDGQLLRTEYDPMATIIAVNSFEIVFQQQDQYLDDIIVISSAQYVPPSVPAPGAVPLGTLGMGLVVWMRQRRPR